MKWFSKKAGLVPADDGKQLCTAAYRGRQHQEGVHPQDMTSAQDTDLQSHFKPLQHSAAAQLLSMLCNIVTTLERPRRLGRGLLESSVVQIVRQLNRDRALSASRQVPFANQLRFQYCAGVAWVPWQPRIKSAGLCILPRLLVMGGVGYSVECNGQSFVLREQFVFQANFSSGIQGPYSLNTTGSEGCSWSHN